MLLHLTNTSDINSLGKLLLDYFVISETKLDEIGPSA